MNGLSTIKDIAQFIDIEKQNKLKRLINFIIGCFLISLAYNVFVAENKIVPGGVGGIAVIINNFFGIDNTITIICLNVILITLSYLLLGVEKTNHSILGTALFPLFIKLTEHANIWLQIDTSKVLLSVLIGGIIYGIGAGFVFKAGYTTGGTDILNQIISKYAKTSIGNSMLMSDGLIVLSSGIFFGIHSLMYSILILYLISYISDRIILGVSDNKMFYIITKEKHKIKEYIIEELKHGATIFKGKGGYKKYKGDVLMTVLPTREYYKFRNGIKSIDKDAFFIVTDAYEVFGGE